jgi:hypothetical protein
MPSLPKMYPVWVEAQNRRVFGIGDDERGTLWFSGGLPKLHRYWPRTGKIDTMSVPENKGGSQCICVAGKVYILPQTQPKITIYRVAEDEMRQVDKPFPEANIWHGQADHERGLIYLSDRSRPCLVVWDVEAEQGEVFPYPEAGTLPSVRSGDWPERWAVFPVPGEGPARRAYFDPETRRFVAEDSEEIPPLRPGTEGQRYLVAYRDGRMTRLDRQTGERYERAVPGWEETFGFIGGGVFWRGWQLNCLGSGYTGSYRYDERTGAFIPQRENPHLGVDGHPYHFMDRFLAYHPESDTFDTLVPDVPEGRYPQLCYSKVVGDHFYITSNNIWSAEKGRALGAVETPVGQLMVLQSHPMGD